MRNGNESYAEAKSSLKQERRFYCLSRLSLFFAVAGIFSTYWGLVILVITFTDRIVFVLGDLLLGAFLIFLSLVTGRIAAHKVKRTPDAANSVTETTPNLSPQEAKSSGEAPVSPGRMVLMFLSARLSIYFAYIGIFFALFGSFLFPTVGYDPLGFLVFYAVMGILPALITLLSGHIAMHMLTKTPGDPTDVRYAVAGLTVSYFYFTTLILMALLVFVFNVPESEPEIAEIYTDQIELQEARHFFRCYAADHPKAFLPELSPIPGRLKPASCGVEFPFIYFRYLPRSPCFPYPYRAHPRRGVNKHTLDGQRYLYLGYLLMNDRETQAFAQAYKERTALGLPVNEDLATPPGQGNNEGARIYRLREGVSDLYIDAESLYATSISQYYDSKIPVMIEVPQLRKRRKVGEALMAGYVLYLDGHVAYEHYPGEWPMTEASINTLTALAGMDAPRCPDGLTWTGQSMR